MLSEEVASILAGAEESYKEGAEEAAPPPEDGTYTVVLKGVKAREIKTKEKGAIPVIRLGLEIISDETLQDYRFSVDFWASNSMSMGEFSTFAAVAAGKPVPSLAMAFSVLEGLVNKVAFDIQVERTKDQKGKEWPHFRALRRVSVE